MKKILALLLTLLLALPALAAGETAVASFYPVYVFALNLADGIEGVNVRLLAPAATGCLHDYQLQTSDMKALAAADVFLINGAGMESFLPLISEALPSLAVVDASQGVALLYGGHSHEHAHEDHSHEHEGEAPNAHIWLDIGNAKVMVRNLCEGLADAWPQHRAALEANRDAYLARLDALDAQLCAGLEGIATRDVVTFHEAFPYFAQAYGLHVVAVVNREPGDALSPAELVRLVRAVQEAGNPPMFVEPQYDDVAAETIALETGAGIYTLDPAVTGPEGKMDQYEQVMLQNLYTLQQALH